MHVIIPLDIAAGAPGAPPHWAGPLLEWPAALAAHTAATTAALAAHTAALAAHTTATTDALNLLRTEVVAAHNAPVVSSEQFLRPVPGLGGVVPPNFPATRGALFNLDDGSVQALLGHYGLPVLGAAAARKNALALHIGLRL